MEKRSFNFSFNKRYEEFCNSLEALKALRKFYDGDYRRPFESDVQDDFEDMMLSSAASKFAITFELAWKLIKDILIENGITDFAIGSPKQNIRRAATIGLVSDVEWLDMCNDRNQLAHDYDGQYVEDIAGRIFRDYIPLLESFREEIERFNFDF